MIESKWIRDALTSVIAGLSTHGPASSIALDDIDKMAQFILFRRADVNDKVRNVFEDELGLAYLYVIATALMLAAFPMYQVKEEAGEANVPQWQRRYRIVAHSFLLQLANYGLSIIRLIEDGQDNAARVLVRTTTELAWQALICLANAKHLDSWLEGDTPEKATQVWSKLFRGQMSSRLKEIERKLGTPSHISEQLVTTRMRSQKFYSQVVHHSFGAIVFGGVAVSIDGEESMDGSIIFGAASDSLRTPLAALNDLFFYFYFLLPRVVEKVRKYPIPHDHAHWKAANVLVAACILIHDKLVSARAAEQSVQPDPGDATRPSAG